ncbi:MAG: hypothetical protein AAFY46_15310, partial [Planctomycetota bacterium]
ADDPARLRGLAALAGRRDVTEFRLGETTFNPLLHEQQRQSESPTPGGIERLLDIADLPLRMMQQQGGTDPFWTGSVTNLNRAILTVLVHAGMPLSYRVLHEIKHSLPETPDGARDPAWQDTSQLFHAIQQLEASEIDPSARGDVSQAVRYLLDEFVSMPDKTRGSVLATDDVAYSRLLYGEVNHTINSLRPCTWSPELVTQDHGVTIMACPILDHGPAAKVVQRCAVEAFQSAVRQRDLASVSRPDFLIIDEAPQFADAERDSGFMMVCRSQRAGVVLVAQTVASLRLTARNAADPQLAAQLLTSTPAVTIACSSSDPDTHQFVSACFTRTKQSRISFGSSRDESGQRDARSRRTARRNHNASFSFEHADDVQPILLR